MSMVVFFYFSTKYNIFFRLTANANMYFEVRFEITSKNNIIQYAKCIRLQFYYYYTMPRYVECNPVVSGSLDRNSHTFQPLQLMIHLNVSIPICGRFHGQRLAKNSFHFHYEASNLLNHQNVSFGLHQHEPKHLLVHQTKIHHHDRTFQNRCQCPIRLHAFLCTSNSCTCSTSQMPRRSVVHPIFPSILKCYKSNSWQEVQSLNKSFGSFIRIENSYTFNATPFSAEC